MNENIKITAIVGIAFLSSFVILGIFLEMYSEGLLTTEKKILDVENIFDQNPKQATIEVLRNFSGVSDADMININNPKEMFLINSNFSTPKTSIPIEPCFFPAVLGTY